MYHHNNLKMWHEWCVNRTFRNFIEGFFTRLKCWFVSVSNKCLNSNSFFNIGFAFDTVQYVRETEGSSWQWRESWFTMQTVLGFIGLGLHIFKTSRNKDFFVDKDMSIKRMLLRCAQGKRNFSLSNWEALSNKGTGGKDKKFCYNRRSKMKSSTASRHHSHWLLMGIWKPPQMCSPYFHTFTQ